MTDFLVDALLSAPEIFLVAAALALLMVGVFWGKNAARGVTWLAIAALAVCAMMTAMTTGTHLAWGGMLRVDDFGRFMKILVLLGSAMALILSLDYFKRLAIDRFEYPVLVLLATGGMMLMISANHLMLLYMGLELQSLALYVLAAFHRDDRASSEAGLKYFLLGALSSGILLYGISLIYGEIGRVDFIHIAEHLFFGANAPTPSIGVVFGLVFIVAGLCFKISAVPFHMWTPDVYQGVPTPVTALFATAPKVAAMALLIRVLVSPFGDVLYQWQQLIVFVAIGSMVLGAFAAINQTNIKRLMAYSSIGNMGYALVGLVSGKADGVASVILYMVIYMVMSLGAFGCIIAMNRNGRRLETIADMAGLSRSNPGLTLAFAIFMFSMAGIPPFAGFFAKFYVFKAAIQAGFNLLAIIGVLTSVVGAYYYIRLVKVMYFDALPDGVGGVRKMAPTVAFVTVLSAVAVALFIFMPAPLVEGAQHAAESVLLRAIPPGISIVAVK